MDATYWQQQTSNKPLFPDLLWSRPENKLHAGKLGVIGGNAYSFAAAATAYGTAEQAGIGTARVLLPDSLAKTVGKLFPEAEFAPSTPSGSFSRKALADVLQLAVWADALLLSGDFGHNSETAVLLESLATKYSGQLTITQDAVDYLVSNPTSLQDRPNTLLVLSFAQLQKLATKLHFSQAFTFNLDLLRLVERLHVFTEQYHLHIIVKHLENILVAVDGQVSSTKLAEDLKVWRVSTAAAAAVWWLQNPTQTFQALTTSLAHSDKK